MTELTLKRLSDVQPERLQWLWPGWMPMGKIVTLDGDPGLGKSTLALDIAATVTTGGRWPDGGTCEHPGAVLLLSGEDGLSDTTVPRALAAGADTSRIHAIEGKSAINPDTGESYLQSITLADVLALTGTIASLEAKLLVVDVLMAFLPGGVDAHKDQDIRRVLTALAKTADAHGCTILLLRHLNKAKGGDPLYRGGGSIGIVGAARSGLLVTADPNDPTRRVLATVKSNLAKMPTALAYRLVDTPDHGVAKVHWDGTVNYNAAELLAGPSPDEDNDHRDVDAWLTTLLTAGPVESDKIYKAADSAGFSKDKAKRAKKRIGVRAYKSSGDGPWMWALRTKGADDQGSTPDPQNPAPLLPCTSEGVHTERKEPREQGAYDRSLGPFELCRHCGETLNFDDDRRTGWHSDKTACVEAQQTHQRASLKVVDSKPSPRQWLREYAADRVARGLPRVNSETVFADGQLAGHSRKAIIDARHHLGVQVIGKCSDGTNDWWLDPNTPAPQNQTILEFSDGYLNPLPDGTVIDIDDYRARGEAADLNWESLRRITVRRPDIQHEDRGRGGTTWTIRRPTTTTRETSA